MTAEIDVPDPTASLLAFFASELKRIRGCVSQEDAARRAHTTQSMLSKIEAMRRVPSEALAHDLDQAFDTGGHFARLYPLVVRYAYPNWFLPHVELEQDATSLRSFQTQVIHGLLQTEEYARATLRAGRPDNLDELVAARMTRQVVFERENPPRTWFVLDEYALLRCLGGPEVMRPQLERLLRAGDDPRTVIQVIPKDKPEHPGLAGPFTLMSFDEGPDVLYVDGFSRGRTATEPYEVTDAAHAYDLLRAVALPPEESAELIGRHLKGLSA